MVAAGSTQVREDAGLEKERLLESVQLSKSFGAFAAVTQLDFVVHRGEAVGFVGPNGAGKSTTFRMLAGSLGPTDGRVCIAGYDLQHQPIQAKRSMGYMPESPPLYPEMTVREYLTYRAALKGLARHERRAQVERTADQTHVGDALDSLIGHLSKGFRQRVALSDALLGEPPVLLLDEPTAGLDPNQVLQMRSLLRTLSRDRALLLSTHVLSEVEAVCDTALVIHRGRLVAQGSLVELKARASTGDVRLVVGGEEPRVRSVIEKMADEARLHLASISQEAGNRCAVIVSAQRGRSTSEITAQVIARFCEEKISVYEATPVRAALDEVFQLLTQPTPPVEDAP